MQLKTRIRLVACLCVMSWHSLNTSISVAEITADEVRNSIRRGVTFLKSQQRVDGHWEDHAGQRGGVTALCTLALLSAGVRTR